jgi:hypothetical protein
MGSLFSIILKIGGLAGLITFFWKIIEEFKSYLFIKVEVKSIDSNYSVFTQVQNTNRLFSKKIHNAFLIISPEQEHLIHSGKTIAQFFKLKMSINDTNSFRNFPKAETTPVYIDKKVVFVPLNFYYSENIDIADEQLTYTSFIDKTKLNKGQYSVRFYLYGKCRYHRSTQDLLIIS